MLTAQSDWVGGGTDGQYGSQDQFQADHYSNRIGEVQVPREKLSQGKNNEGMHMR